MENALKDGFTYDAEAVVVPVMCTGLVKVSHLLKLFAKGMRGVLVLGCDEGDCRYYNGSARCAEIVKETQEILGLAGIAPDRLQFHLISETGGSEAKRVLKTFLKHLGMAVRGGKTATGAKARKAGKAKPKRSTGTRKIKQGTRTRAAKKGKKRGTSRRHR
jgi:coenzyme F420-reducing hydrogenase delta subunit